MWHGDWNAADWLMMSFGMVVFWTVVVVGVVLLVKNYGTGSSGRAEQMSLTKRSDSTQPSAARAILDERYARGELSDEEYLARRETLASR